MVEGVRNFYNKPKSFSYQFAVKKQLVINSSSKSFLLENNQNFKSLYVLLALLIRTNWNVYLQTFEKNCGKFQVKMMWWKRGLLKVSSDVYVTLCIILGSSKIACKGSNFRNFVRNKFHYYFTIDNGIRIAATKILTRRSKLHFYFLVSI